MKIAFVKARVAVLDDRYRAGYRIMQGWCVAEYGPVSCVWCVQAWSGTGIGSSPEIAARAASRDGGIAPLGYRTRREVKADLKRQRDFWETPETQEGIE